MTMHLRRCTSLLLCTVLCAALSVVAAVGAASSAGALQPRLTTTTSSLNFGEATLGTYVGPQSFTMTNTTGANLTVTFAFSGPAANDWAWSFESNCPNPSDASGEVITLAAGQACTVDVFFYPGALGARDATLNLTDPVDAGSSIALSGTGGIGYYQVSSTGTVAYAGDAAYYGDASAVHLNQPIVGHGRQPGDDGGYSAGGVGWGHFHLRERRFLWLHGRRPSRTSRSWAWLATPDGKGYWLVASDGGIFTFGDAHFYGSTGAVAPEQADRGHGGHAGW